MLHGSTIAFCLLLAGCAGTPTQPTDLPPAPEPEPEVVIAQPIPHDGPLVADPAAHHCGFIPEYEACSFESHIRNGAGDILIVDAVRQDFAPTATIGIIEDRTAFDRDLPYEMRVGETLRLLFDYRRRDPSEVVGGSLFVRYHTIDGSEYQLEIPISAEN